MDKIQLLVMAAIAIFVFVRLFRELGSKTGNEEEVAQEWKANKTREEKVETDPKTRRNEDRVEINESAQGGLQALRDVEPSFLAYDFIKGAQYAFEMIIDAFSKGDDQPLQDLLARDVYKNFKQSIDQRKERGEEMQTVLVGFKQREITAVSVDEGMAFITVRFVTEQSFELKDSAGTIIDSSHGQVEDVVDIWTFARKLNDNNPNWTLVKTETEELA